MFKIRSTPSGAANPCPAILEENFIPLPVSEIRGAKSTGVASENLCCPPSTAIPWHSYPQGHSTPLSLLCAGTKQLDTFA